MLILAMDLLGFYWFHMVFHTISLEQQMKVPLYPHLKVLGSALNVDLYGPRTPEDEFINSCLRFSSFQDVSAKTNAYPKLC